MQKLKSDDVNLNPPVRACGWMLGWWRDWKFERGTGTSLEQWQSRGRYWKFCSLNSLPNWEEACEWWLWEWCMTNMNQCSLSCLPELARRRRSIYYTWLNFMYFTINRAATKAPGSCQTLLHLEDFSYHSRKGLNACGAPRKSKEPPTWPAGSPIYTNPSSPLTWLSNYLCRRNWPSNPPL